MNLLSLAKSLALSKYGPAFVKVLAKRTWAALVKRNATAAEDATTKLGSVIIAKQNLLVRIDTLQDRYKGLPIPAQVQAVIKMMKAQIVEIDDLLEN